MSLRHNPMIKSRFDGYREDTSSIHEVVEVASRFTDKIRSIPVHYAILVENGYADRGNGRRLYRPQILNGHLLMTRDGLKIRTWTSDMICYNIRSRMYVYANREGRYQHAWVNHNYYLYKWWFTDERTPKMEPEIDISKLC